MFVERDVRKTKIKEHTGTNEGHAKERAGITKDTKGTTSTFGLHRILFSAKPARRVCPLFARALHRELSYRIGLVVVAVPGLLADSSPPVARCVALGQLRVTTAVAVLPRAPYERSFGREGVTAAGAQRGLIGSRNHVCDLGDQDAEEITGIGSDLEIAAIAVHRYDSVPARMGE